jgi:hypothetical protein
MLWLKSNLFTVEDHLNLIRVVLQCLVGYLMPQASSFWVNSSTVLPTPALK